MKKIGFIGAFDKTDLIIYVAKILVETGKKVLVMDTTITQKARYIVPCIKASKYYITEYEGIDVSVGFFNFNSIKEYLGVEELNYDIILIDVDSNDKFLSFQMTNADNNFFVTAFDNYSLKRGLEIVGKMEEKVFMTKILFSHEMLKEEDNYLNFLSFYYSIQWQKQKIYFLLDNGDNKVIIENQRAARIKFKDLSREYKEGLIIIAQLILSDVKESEIKRAFRSI